MLILVAVTITMAVNGGLFGYAQKANSDTRASQVEEMKSVWQTVKYADELTGEQNAQTLEEFLDGLEAEQIITAGEKEEIKEKGHVVIGSKDISFSDGIKAKSYTVTSSDDEIKFERTVTEGDILAEKPEYTSYSIEGISNEKNGTYIATTVEGKSGNLEVVGNIQNATFKYNLTSVMCGDDIFYVKIKTDGEEKIQELKVIQGDVITYEEDFVGFEYTNEESWEDDINENYSGGKAKRIQVRGAKAKLLLKNGASKYELVTRSDDTTTMVRITTENEAGVINNIMYYDMTGIGDGTIQYQAILEFEGRFDNRAFEIGATPLTFGGITDIYLDAVRVYK